MGSFGPKSHFEKKSLQNLTKFGQKWLKCRIFEISNVALWPEMADNRPKNISKVPVCPKFLPKFFLSPNLKNWWKYPKTVYPPPPPKSPLFGGGGGKIIKCRKRQKCLNMHKNRFCMLVSLRDRVQSMHWNFEINQDLDIITRLESNFFLPRGTKEKKTFSFFRLVKGKTTYILLHRKYVWAPPPPISPSSKKLPSGAFKDPFPRHMYVSCWSCQEKKYFLGYISSVSTLMIFYEEGKWRKCNKKNW